MALNINQLYFVDHNENMIYRKEKGKLVEDESVNRKIDEELQKKLQKKLKIVTKVTKEDEREFRSGVDKILNIDDKSVGYKLIITMNDNIIHEFNACTDDYKFGTYEENKKKIKEIIEQKEKLYTKLLMNIYINNLSKQLKEPEYMKIGVDNLPAISSQAGGYNLTKK